MRNIVLTGFMGTGKTTVGRLVANKLGWRFVDSDAVIVQRVGMSIPQIFAQQGEAAFRQYEREVCSMLAAGERQVIATGGGMLVDSTNRETMLKSGLVICLTATVEAIRRRLKGGKGRPLAANWESLLEQRRTVYAQIPHQIDTTGKSSQQVAGEVLALWKHASE